MLLSKNERSIKNADYSKRSGLINIFLTYVDEKSLCLICMQQISVVKECSISRHYYSRHGDNVRNL